MTDEITAEEYVATKERKPNKYGNRSTTIDGHVFASIAEGKRYRELKLMVMAGEIADLELQPAFALVVNGVKIGRYTGDFRYIDLESGRTVIEDVKGAQSRDYPLRKKLMKALFGIDVTEIRA